MSPRSRRPHPGRRAPGALAVVAALALAACGGDPAPTGAAFCDAIVANDARLRPATDPAAATESLEAFRAVQKVAPAPVRDAWGKVTELVEAAAALDVTSKEDQAAFATRALEALGDIRTITDYTKTTCGVDLNVGV